MVLAEHRLIIRYDGGEAQRGRLELYEGTLSIHGVAQALSLATHAYLNRDVVSRATALKGAKMYLRPARRGSFLFDLITLIEAYPATATSAVAISAPVFYDFIKLAMKRATGLLHAEPETRYLQKLLERKEPTFDEPFLDQLAEQMEGSLQRAHRPIGDSALTLDIERPRGMLVRFDSETKDWVNTREEDREIEVHSGNVTRFNVLSRNGRAYIKQFDKTVPFRPSDEFRLAALPLITWSLHQSNGQADGTLLFKVRHVRSARGESKRLLLLDCERPPD